MYKIEITEVREVRKTLAKTWDKIGEKEVERERMLQEEGEAKTRIEPVMGYTPEVETVVSERRTVLTQEVDALNLKNVIRAINEL